MVVLLKNGNQQQKQVEMVITLVIFVLVVEANIKELENIYGNILIVLKKLFQQNSVQISQYYN